MILFNLFFSLCFYKSKVKNYNVCIFFFFQQILEENKKGEADLMQEWYSLLHTKNKLMREEQELLIRLVDYSLYFIMTLVRQVLFLISNSKYSISVIFHIFLVNLFLHVCFPFIISLRVSCFFQNFFFFGLEKAVILM